MNILSSNLSFVVGSLSILINYKIEQSCFGLDNKKSNENPQDLKYYGNNYGNSG